MVILVPDDKLDRFVLMYFFALDKNGLPFYPGPVMPPRTDDFPIFLEVFAMALGLVA